MDKELKRQPETDEEEPESATENRLIETSDMWTFNDDERRSEMCGELPFCGKCGIGIEKDKRNILCSHYVRDYPTEARAIIDKYFTERDTIDTIEQIRRRYTG